MATAKGNRVAAQDETFLTPAQLSARWGGRIKVSTLANWRSQGKGPKCQPLTKSPNAPILYALSDVIDYEDEMRVGGTD